MTYVPSNMKAAVYRGKNEICIENVPVPEIGPGELLVRIRKCGVCGTDLKKIQYGLVSPPRIFGHEMAGDIVKIGDGVSKWNVGDRVAVMHHVPCMECHYCQNGSYAQCILYKATGTTAGFEPAGGGFAEYIRVMDWIVERGVIRLPDNCSYEDATFIEPLNTVMKAVNSISTKPDQTILIAGQGQIGLLFTEMLAIRGCRVITTDPIAWRRTISLEFGALRSLDPTDPVAHAHIMEATCGRGLDTAILAVPVTSAIKPLFDWVRPGGTLMLFAHTRLKDFTDVDAGEVCMLEKKLVGSYSADIGLQQHCADFIFEGKVRAQRLITHRFPLDSISDAIDLASSPSDNSLKVMITL